MKEQYANAYIYISQHCSSGLLKKIHITTYRNKYKQIPSLFCLDMLETRNTTITMMLFIVIT